MLGCSFGNGHRLNDDLAYEDILIQAATSLASRFDPDVGCIRSWDFGSWQFPVIVDNMMNLELLFTATQMSGDSSYWKKAVSHADVTMLHHYRDDYSSYHVVDYNKTTGDTIAKHTHQGYSRESAWARGQSWGLYGYTMCYRFTGDPRYLEHAENIALFLIQHENLPEDLVPYWDFDAPGIPNEPRDVAAATIMCSALFELSKYSEQHGDTFLNTALEQINSFASAEYTAETDSNNNFILKHGTGNYPAGREIDKPLNYADYYYLEALTRYRRLLNSAPQADFEYTQTDSITKLEIAFDASGSVDPEEDSFTWLWDFGDGSKVFSPDASTSHVYAGPGDYTVTLTITDRWGVSDTIEKPVTVEPFVAVDQLDAGQIKVFPNPASDGFYLELPHGYAKNGACLVNTAGKKYPVNLESGNTWIPNEGWHNGMFILVIPGNNNEIIRRKIIVVNN
jgi:PKD repeat protein